MVLLCISFVAKFNSKLNKRTTTATTITKKKAVRKIHWIGHNLKTLLHQSDKIYLFLYFHSAVFLNIEQHLFTKFFPLSLYVNIYKIYMFCTSATKFWFTDTETVNVPAMFFSAWHMCGEKNYWKFNRFHFSTFLLHFDFSIITHLWCGVSRYR